MYRLLRPWVCLVVLGANLVVNGPARSADAAVCLEMGREFYLTRDISSLQLNLLLFSAADKGCEFLARRLLAAGAAVESRDGRGAMPLARAARSGHLALVELLVDHGAPVNARDIAGSTALYDAAENDRVSVVRRLLEKGADPNLPGRSGVTPLAAAAFKGNLEIVEFHADCAPVARGRRRRQCALWERSYRADVGRRVRRPRRRARRRERSDAPY
jgi:hypothetical protein